MQNHRTPTLRLLRPAALALGLIGGLSVGDPVTSVGLMALIIAVIAIGDSPRLLSRSRSQLLHLDGAFTDRTALVAHLEQLLGGRVRRVEVRKLDLVSDTTLVEVHYDQPKSSAPAPTPAVELVDGVRR